ncbi:MAG: NAD(P)-dependent oxidoreductase [Gammaproteobacteria bacterium]
MSTPTDRLSASVLGLGRMGSAVADCLADAGVPLTVWNRTPARAFGFDGRAAIGLNAGAACAGSELIVLCLSDYGAGFEVLDEAAEAVDLAGRTLLQLTSGTASDARTMQAWAQMHRMHYLDGAILGYPSGIGTDATIIFYAGEESSFERVRDTLAPLAGTNRYVGEDAGAAATFDCAALGFYYGAALALLGGAALCEAENLPLTEFFFIAKKMLPMLSATADASREMIGREVYAGNQCDLDTHAAALRHVQRMMHDSEVDTRLADTLMAAFKRALGDGLGDDELPALFETLRSSRGGGDTP